MKKIFNIFLSIALVLTASAGFYMPKASADLSDVQVVSWYGNPFPSAETHPLLCFVPDISFSGATNAYIDVTFPAGFTVTQTGTPAYSAFLYLGPGTSTQIVDWNATNVTAISNVLHYVFDNNSTALNSGQEICMSTYGTGSENNVAITNPSTAGDYTVTFELGSGSGTTSSGTTTYTIYNSPLSDALTVNLSSYDDNTSNVSSVFSFTTPEVLHRGYLDELTTTFQLMYDSTFSFSTTTGINSLCTMTADGTPITLDEDSEISYGFMRFKLPPSSDWPGDYPAGTEFVITCDPSLISRNYSGTHDLYLKVADPYTNQEINYYRNDLVIDNISLGEPMISSGNSTAGEAPGQTVITFTPTFEMTSGDSYVEVEIPSAYTADNIDGTGDDHLWEHATMSYNSEGAVSVSLSESDTDTNLTSKVVKLTPTTTIPAYATTTVTLDSTVIDQNPTSGGVYAFDTTIYYGESGGSSITRSLYTMIEAAGASIENLSTTLTNSNAGAAPGVITSQFTPGIEIPADGASVIAIQFPEGFTLNDIDGTGDDHLWNHVTVTYGSGEPTTVNLVESDASTLLSSGEVVLIVNTTIPSDALVTVTMDSTVVDQNPSSAGNYTITYNVYNATTSDLKTATDTVAIAAASSTGHDYTADGSTVTLVSGDAGHAKLPTGEHRAIFTDDQKIDFDSNLTAGDPSEVIDGSTVGDELAELIGDGSTVTGVQEVSIEVGDGSSETTVEIVGSDSTATFTSGTTVSGASSTTSGDGVWDGDFTTPSDDDVSRIGFTKNAVSKIGSETAPLVMDQPIKVDLNGSTGDPYYTSNGVTWQKISACPSDATLSSAGSLGFADVCYLEDSGETVIWSYHLTTFGNLTHNAVLVLGNDGEGEDPGTMDFSFTSGSTVPSGGELLITFPDEFTISDNADISSYLTTFTDDGSNVTVNSASMESNTITIDIGSEISQDSQLVLHFATGLITSNPTESGQYAVDLATKDTEGTVISTGYVNANVGNEISITATVQEALIMTIEEGAIINLDVDPSVNNGEEFSQKTVLQVKTNAAAGYKIQAFLDNGSGAAQLQNGTEYITSSSVYAGSSYVPNTFSYLAYNNANGTDPVTKADTDLKTDLESTGASVAFSASSADMTLYDGTASGVGNSIQTNAQNHTIYYLLFVDYMTKAGIYSGEIVYTAYPTF